MGIELGNRLLDMASWVHNGRQGCKNRRCDMCAFNNFGITVHVVVSRTMCGPPFFHPDTKWYLRGQRIGTIIEVIYVWIKHRYDY